MKLEINSAKTLDLIPMVKDKKKKVNTDHFHLAYNKLKECCLDVQCLNSIIDNHHDKKNIGVGIVKKKQREYHIVLEVDNNQKVKSIKYGRKDEIDYNYAHIISYANDLFKGSTLKDVEEINSIYIKDKNDITRIKGVYAEYLDATKFAFGYALSDAIKELQSKNKKNAILIDMNHQLECGLMKLYTKVATFNSMNLNDVKQQSNSYLIEFD